MLALRQNYYSEEWDKERNRVGEGGERRGEGTRDLTTLLALVR
jgi:hypothetical protein